MDGFRNVSVSQSRKARYRSPALCFVSDIQMVTYESAFQHVKPVVKAGVFAKLRGANFDLDGEVDDSFLGLDDIMLKEAGLDLPERGAVKTVLLRLKEGGSVCQHVQHAGSSTLGP